MNYLSYPLKNLINDNLDSPTTLLLMNKKKAYRSFCLYRIIVLVYLKEGIFTTSPF